MPLVPASRCVRKGFRLRPYALEDILLDSRYAKSNTMAESRPDNIELDDYDNVDDDYDVGTTGGTDDASFTISDQNAETVGDNKTPSWANGNTMPDGVQEENMADAAYTDKKVNQWHNLVAKYGIQADLEFKAFKRGDLWVKWGREWILLTRKITSKGVPPKFLASSTLQSRYGKDVTNNLGVTCQLPAQVTSSLRNLAHELAQAATQTNAATQTDGSDIIQTATAVINAVEDPSLT
jgi:hypothetical protein